MSDIRLGFEVPSGDEVRIAPHHLGITGLTQKSGKTTALEALMSRANETAIAFRTSRGELGFPGAARIAPFFRERTDWRFVEGLISAHLHEKAKFYRGDLMRLVRGTHTLPDVHANVKKALAKTVPGRFQEKIYTELDEYLTEVRRDLDRVRFASVPNLTPRALSVMDLEGLSAAVQQLVVSATVDWLMEGHLAMPVYVVLPEAKDFIPEGRLTPAKQSLDDLIRKGARVGRFLWLDSQSLTGLDMDVCRNIGTWLFGNQSLDLEINRVGKMVPGRKLKRDEVRALRIGEFLLVQGETVRKVYAQPTWLPDLQAQAVARRDSTPETAARMFGPKPEEKNVDDEERKRYEERIEELDRKLQAMNERAVTLDSTVLMLKQQLEASEAKVLALQTSARTAQPVDPDDSPPGPVLRQPSGAGPSPSEPDGCNAVDVRVVHEAPSLTVHVNRPTIEKTTTDTEGRMAYLIAEGFFDTPKTANAVRDQFKGRDWGAWSGGAGHTNMWKLLEKFRLWEFLDRVGDAYVLRGDAKKRVRRKVVDA